MPTPLRAVLVGCGGISRAWVEASQTISDFELVGFADVQEAAAQKRAADYGGSPVIGTHLATVLRQTKPDIVFDCTIPQAHFNITMTALEHGCHVLGEKPLADSMEHARKMVVAAHAAGKLYAVMQNRRYDANIRRLKHLLDSGALGQLTTLNCDFYVGAHFRDFRDHMNHILLLDMAIHTFDAARFICGAEAVSVYCKEWNPAGSWYDQDASAVAIFEMSNGVVYTYRGSWVAEGFRTTWESDWRVIGQQGTARWDGGPNIQAQIVTDSSGFFSTYTDLDIPSDPHSDKIDAHKGLIRNFVECVRSGVTPDTICTDNIKSLAMVFGAIESAETGKAVSIARSSY